jgi:hypothetical protein
MLQTETLLMESQSPLLARQLAVYPVLEERYLICWLLPQAAVSQAALYLVAQKD